MNMWCHLPTGFKGRRMLQFAVLSSIIVALITALIFAVNSQAAPGINKTISLQGRLLTTPGAVVPDGHYNMQFKIYQDGAGTAANNPGGSLKWTETYINNGGESGVTVKNGFFSVSLGSITPFSSSVDWNQDTLWVSMNVAGSETTCTSFGTAPCTADGEMLPMKQLSATPFALNAGAVGGKTANEILQLAQGVQNDASSNTSSIFINKTGTGNLIQLQNTATDVFTVSNSGDLTLGSNANKSISIATSDTDSDGKQLSITGGAGGSGTGTNGGDLILQGGAAGGANGDGGNLQIDAGAKTGDGTDGTIAIGEANASSITIGSTSVAREQNINIGTNNTAGSVSNITIGSGGSAEGGTTTLQGKNGVTISTNGTTRATFSDTTNTVYFGNGVSSTTPSDSTIQGTNSSSNAIAGGSLTVQGGNATTGNANGGNITLSGGTGSGTGANGLVVLSTPTFSTVTDDANCYTGGAIVASSCTITAQSVNNSSAILVGFNTSGQTASLPDPTITTAGRIIYIMAADTSQDFTLSLNDEDTLSQTLMKKNTATTVVWNGSDWIVAGGSSSTTLQDAYNNSSQSAGGTELLLNNTSGNNGLTIRDNSTNPVNDTLLEVQNTSSSKLFSVNSKVTDGVEHTTDGTVNDEDFTTNWSATGSASVSRITSDGQEASDSVQVAAGTSANNGVRNKLSINPSINSQYRVSVYTKLTTGTPLTDLQVRYSPDNGSTFVDCADYNTQTVTTSGWTQLTCTITTGATPATNPYIYLVQPTTAENARTFLVDTLSFTLASSSTPNVKVGSGAGDGQATLFTVDKSATAPTASDNDALLGSMYYDTTIGKVQCYEAEGWGACGSSPDNFVTISPEYSNAVMNGNDIGTISSDLCSDALNINDGSSSQPTICGTNETYNLYKWTTTEATPQTRSIYVTYQLPTTFKEFIAGSTSLLGRTDNSDSTVSYQIYRDNSSSGLTSCGSVIPVSTGAQSSWQKAVATGSTDPAECGFTAGDSILFRINLLAKSNANAYVSDLGFTFSNH